MKVKSGLRKSHVVFIVIIIAFCVMFLSWHVFDLNFDVLRYDDVGSENITRGSENDDYELYSGPTSGNNDRVSKCDIGLFNDPDDPRFYNIMLEDQALKYQSCQDVRMAASPETSRVALIGGDKKSFQTGETILVRVDLYDDYGHKKDKGGDIVRATIDDTKGYHHAPGVVTDNLDGTYTVELKAYWSGPSFIKVIIAYNREAVTAVYRSRTKVLSARNVYAKFESRKFSEEVLCHPNHTRLSASSNNAPLCNMTYLNSGMPFYCVKPNNVHLLCQDWMFSISRVSKKNLLFNICEQTLIKRIHTQLRQRLKVNIEDGTDCKTSPQIPCSKYDVSNSWTSREPTGYFKGNKWNFVRCRGLSEDRIFHCLRNKTLYMIGDSTIRQWYTHLQKRIACKQTTEGWTNEKWHKASECILKNAGFKMGWYPHSQPFCVVTWEEARYTQISIARRIDDIPNNEYAIVVFQIYMHHLVFHHSVAQGRYAIIRKSVENFLNRNKNSVVLIKGPHTFYDPQISLILNDCYEGLYTKMIYDAFKGLHDRVYLLNNKDATIAAHTRPNHPPQNIVSAMVDQMLNFACK